MARQVSTLLILVRPCIVENQILTTAKIEQKVLLEAA
jgi:hypothetical protein